ncbi:MAG TPA: hypothetical protein VMB18_02145 [Terriglobales bacterium]|nr:hypothetical protein [Terriglobales bacterium]
MGRLPAVMHALLVTLLFLGGYAQAQTASFQVNVPFDFVTGHNTLPAGNYVFERLLGKPSKGDTVGIIVVRNPDQRIYRAIVTSVNAQPSDPQSSDSKIVFRRSRGRHYLDQIWISGDEAVHVLTTVPRGPEIALDSTTDVITLARLR